jgi:patatin-like phospholipase/acyl hydrolase
VGSDYYLLVSLYRTEFASVDIRPADGGGIRGLSELIILREIMQRIQRQEDLHEPPRPCDHFDMICGTGTGGYAVTLSSDLF